MKEGGRKKREKTPKKRFVSVPAALSGGGLVHRVSLVIVFHQYVLQSNNMGNMGKGAEEAGQCDRRYL